MPVVLTFIRHGQSEDNPKTIWAGWKDAPLSELGRKQAKAVGQHFSNTRFRTIYASDLLRAHETGKQVHVHQSPESDCQFVVTNLLREQHFGIAEGHPYTFKIPHGKTREDLYAENIYPVLYERHESFVNGESLNDLSNRAQQAVKECVLPHLSDDNLISEDEYHIGLASHGLCISEMVASVLSLDPTFNVTSSYAGLLNTAWTRVVLSPRSDGPAHPEKDVPKVQAVVTHINVSHHLEGLEVEESDAVDNEATEESAKGRAYLAGQTTA